MPRRPRANRAAQFMPFAALRGYYDLLRTKERVPEPRHELTEEEARELSAVARECAAAMWCARCTTTATPMWSGRGAWRASTSS